MPFWKRKRTADLALTESDKAEAEAFAEKLKAGDINAYRRLRKMLDDNMSYPLVAKFTVGIVAHLLPQEARANIVGEELIASLDELSKQK